MAISVLVNGILLGGTYALLTIPLTLIFGVLGFIHLAHGDFIMVGAYLTFWLFNMSGMDPFYSLGLTIILLLMVGLFLKRFLINPVLKAPVINQLLLSFGIAITLQSLVLLLFTGDYISIKTWYSSKSITFGPVSISFTRFMGFLIACFFTGLLMLGLKKTEWGRVLRAVAQNEEATLLIGARPAQAYTIAFSVAFILAAVAGMITTLTMYSYPTIGFTFSIKAFSVAVLEKDENSFRNLLKFNSFIFVCHSSCFFGGLWIAYSYHGHDVNSCWNELEYISLHGSDLTGARRLFRNRSVYIGYYLQCL
jgi:branched-chain amino acid transport system permease protein